MGECRGTSEGEPSAELSIPIYLEPDVAKVFRNSAAVNQALRSLLRISETTRCLAATKAHGHESSYRVYRLSLNSSTNRRAASTGEA